MLRPDGTAGAARARPAASSSPKPTADAFTKSRLVKRADIESFASPADRGGRHAARVAVAELTEAVVAPTQDLSRSDQRAGGVATDAERRRVLHPRDV